MDNEATHTETVNGNLTTYVGYTVSESRAHYGARTHYNYTRCNICRVADAAPGGGAGCTATECHGEPLAASFAPGDAVAFAAGGWVRLGTVVAVKGSKVVASYRIKTGETRTTTKKAGSFWAPVKG